MATAAKSAFGTYLKIGDGATAESFATIAEVLDIKGLSTELGTVDVTSHDSTDGWDEVIGTILKTEELEFEVNWLPGHATHNSLHTDHTGRVKRNFQLVIPAAATATCAFTALVTKVAREFPVDGVQKAAFSLKPSGKPTWT